MSKETLNGIDIIYWINLDRSTDRKDRMNTLFKDPEFNNIPIQRFSAIDGKKDNIDSMITVKEKKITKPEYGCLLSHLEIINEFSQTDYNVALILEDDITLDFKKYWTRNIKEVIDNAPIDWEIIMLCYHSDNLPSNLYTRNNNNFWSTAAYIINNKSAKKIINEIYNNNTYHLEDNIKHAADDYLFIKLKTYVYKYPYFIYGYSEKTTIPTSNVRYHNYSRLQIENMYEDEIKNNNENDNEIEEITEGFSVYNDIIYDFYSKYFIYLFLLIIFFIIINFKLLRKKINLFIKTLDFYK